MGLAAIRNISKYHRVLSRAEWDSLGDAGIKPLWIGLGRWLSLVSRWLKRHGF